MIESINLKDPLSIPEFLLFMIGVFIVMALVITLISEGADKSKEVAKNIKEKFDQKKLNKEINNSILTNIQEYQKFKKSFQYLSNDRLLNIYEQFLNGTKNSNIKQLALEEELVKRKLINHSTMHEKLKEINKEIFK